MKLDFSLRDFCARLPEQPKRQFLGVWEPEVDFGHWVQPHSLNHSLEEQSIAVRLFYLFYRIGFLLDNHDCPKTGESRRSDGDGF